MKTAWHLAVFGTLCLSPLACNPGDPHDNFKAIVGSDVGKRADHPHSHIVLYADRFVGETVLDNGNIEKKYQHRGSCVSFYEIDWKTNIIVGWRFEGSKADCTIQP